LHLTPAVEDRSVEVQTLLADRGQPDRGQHRALSVPDLIVAATAEFAGLTVLHADKDFEVIAEITGQPSSASTQADADVRAANPDRRLAEPVLPRLAGVVG
jgi:predicted nucleic acid-binding protein